MAQKMPEHCGIKSCPFARYPPIMQLARFELRNGLPTRARILATGLSNNLGCREV